MEKKVFSQPLAVPSTDQPWRKYVQSLEITETVESEIVKLYAGPAALRSDTCLVCQVDLDKAGRIEHYRVHTGLRTQLCLICEMAFATEDEVREHCQEHMRKKETKKMDRKVAQPNREELPEKKCGTFDQSPIMTKNREVINVGPSAGNVATAEFPKPTPFPVNNRGVVHVGPSAGNVATAEFPKPTPFPVNNRGVVHVGPSAGNVATAELSLPPSTPQPFRGFQESNLPTRGTVHINNVRALDVGLSTSGQNVMAQAQFPLPQQYPFCAFQPPNLPPMMHPYTNRPLPLDDSVPRAEFLYPACPLYPTMATQPMMLPSFSATHFTPAPLRPWSFESIFAPLRQQMLRNRQAYAPPAPATISSTIAPISHGIRSDGMRSTRLALVSNNDMRRAYRAHAAVSSPIAPRRNPVYDSMRSARPPPAPVGNIIPPTKKPGKDGISVFEISPHFLLNPEEKPLAVNK